MISDRLLQNIFQQKERIQQKTNHFYHPTSSSTWNITSFLGWVVGWHPFLQPIISKKSPRRWDEKPQDTPPRIPRTRQVASLNLTCPEQLRSVRSSWFGRYVYRIILPHKNQTIQMYINKRPKRMVMVYGLVNLSFCVAVIFTPTKLWLVNLYPPCPFPPELAGRKGWWTPLVSPYFLGGGSLRDKLTSHDYEKNMRKKKTCVDIYPPGD